MLQLMANYTDHMRSRMNQYHEPDKVDFFQKKSWGLGERGGGGFVQVYLQSISPIWF